MAKKKVWKYVLAVCVLVAVVAGGKTLLDQRQAQTTAAGEQKTQPAPETAVTVVEAKKQTVSPELSFKASLAASQEGTLSAKQGGKVVAVAFENGDSVSAGRVLVRLDDTDIRNNITTTEAQITAAEAQLTALQAQIASSKITLEKPQTNLRTVQLNYDRTKTLFEQGVASQIEMENAETALQVAKTDLESAEASLAASEMSYEAQRATLDVTRVSLRVLQDSLSNMSITAPISGILAEKSVSLGQYVNPGTPLGKVKSISPIHAVIEVKESDLEQVSVGTKAVFQSNDAGSVPFEGTIQSIDPLANEASRLFTCKVALSNADQKLKPGMFGSVKLQTTAAKEAIMLPLKALGGDEGAYYVFVAEEGKAKKREVTIGEIGKDSAEILSGVSSGESVITSNVGTLQDGSAVKTAE